MATSLMREPAGPGRYRAFPCRRVGSARAASWDVAAASFRSRAPRPSLCPSLWPLCALTQPSTIALARAVSGRRGVHRPLISLGIPISVLFLTSAVTCYRRRPQLRNLSTQDEYFRDLRCFYIQLRILNSGLGKNVCVVFSVGRPGSLIQLLPLVKCGCLSTHTSMVWNGETARLPAFP